MLYEFEQVYNATEYTKNICSAKGEGAVDHITDGWINFVRVARTSTIRQYLLGQKQWIPNPCYKPLR